MLTNLILSWVNLSCGLVKSKPSALIHCCLISTINWFLLHISTALSHGQLGNPSGLFWCWKFLFSYYQTLMQCYTQSYHNLLFSFSLIILCRWPSIKLGINMPARAEKTIRRSDCEASLIGEATGELYEVILFFGIIDILQDYDISKKLEHAYKSMQYDPTSISAVDPKQYSKRFRDFILRVFVEDTWWYRLNLFKFCNQWPSVYSQSFLGMIVCSDSYPCSKLLGWFAEARNKFF